MTGRFVLPALMAVVTLVLGAGISAAARGPKPQEPGSSEPRSFELRGAVEGLYPGAATTLYVKVENPYAFDILVSDLVAEPGDASDACPGSALRFVPVAGDVPVEANGEAEIAVATSMAETAPDACQGAVFPLTYTAQGRRAN